MLSQLVPLVLFGIATSFSPGPNNIMTSYTAFNFGIKKTIPTMLGVIIGWTLLIILLQLGSVSIFQKYQFIQTIIKVLGSIYLLYMAYKLSFGGQNKDKKLDPKPVTFINTFFFQFVNPKSIIVGLTSISLFVDTIGSAFQEIGFCAVRGHFLDDQLVKRLYDQIKLFFDLPTDIKKKYEHPEFSGQRGYVLSLIHI